MNKFVLITFVLLFVLTGKSQTIDNVDFEYKDEKIFLYYDVLNCKDDYKYEVLIQFQDFKGNIIIPNSLSGDFGLISCGKDKRVIWSVFKDLELLEGNYKAIVSIKNTFDSKGNQVEMSSNDLKIVSLENNRSNIRVKLISGPRCRVKPDSKYLLTNKAKIIGVVNISECIDRQCDGILKLKNQSSFEDVKNTIYKSSVNKYNMFSITVGSLVQLGNEHKEMDVVYGVNALYYSKNYFYLGFNYYTSNYYDFELGISLILNSKVKFFSGISYTPIVTTDKYSGLYFKHSSRFGFDEGISYRRLKLQFKFDFGKINVWTQNSEGVDNLTSYTKDYHYSLQFSYIII